MSPTVDASRDIQSTVNNHPQQSVTTSAEEETNRPGNKSRNCSPAAPHSSPCSPAFASFKKAIHGTTRRDNSPLFERVSHAKRREFERLRSTRLASRNRGIEDGITGGEKRALIHTPSTNQNFRQARLFRAGYEVAINGSDHLDIDSGGDIVNNVVINGDCDSTKTSGKVNFNIDCLNIRPASYSTKRIGCDDILETFSPQDVANCTNISDTDESSLDDYQYESDESEQDSSKTSAFLICKGTNIKRNIFTAPIPSKHRQGISEADQTDQNETNKNNGNDVIVQDYYADIMTATSGTHLNTNMNGHATSDGSGEAEATPKESPKRTRRTLDPNHVSHQFFHLEPCLYSHRMFQRAARIFSVLKHDDADTDEKKAMRRRNGETTPSVKEKIPDMDFVDSQEQIKTFELTFATLKFQRLFSAILDYIGFFYKYSDLNDRYSLVYVILHDLQTRRFQRRTPFPDEVLDPVCLEVEEALLNEKTRLQANIAKERIKHNAPSVDFLLPEHVRNKDETKAKTPVYMWVNQFKTTIDNIISNLKADDYRLMNAATDMSEVTDQAFLIDPHCSDVLTFPPHMNMELKTSDMVTSGLLVQQDKSSCLAPQTVSHLLGSEHDIIHVNIGTAMTTCHLASLLRDKSPHIWAFGVTDPQKVSKVMRTLEFLEVKNVKMANEEFLNVDPEDSRYKGVRVILISANCSKSAITSPVQFIVSEGEDTQILGELSVGEADMNHVRDLMVDHERLLKHALKFPRVQAVVYTTRSRFELENESVVTKVLEYVNMTNNKRSMFKIAPPVLTFNVDEINTGKGGVDERYLRFLPTDKANGCFVAIIAREPEETKDSKLSSDKKKSKLGKSKSAQSASQGSSGTQKNRKSLKSVKSMPANIGNGIEEEDDSSQETPRTRINSGGSGLAKKASHKSAVGIGARLYQEGVMKQMEKARPHPSRPEHLKVVKHPAPFREDQRDNSRPRSRTPSRHNSGSRSGRDTVTIHSLSESVERK